MRKEDFPFLIQELEELNSISECDRGLKTRDEERKIVENINIAIDKLRQDQSFDLKAFVDDLAQHKTIIENSLICMTLLAKLLCLTYFKKSTFETQETWISFNETIKNFIFNSFEKAKKLHIETNTYLHARNNISLGLSGDIPTEPDFLLSANFFNSLVKNFATAILLIIENNPKAKRIFFTEDNINSMITAIKYSTNPSAFTRMVSALYFMKTLVPKLSLTDVLNSFNTPHNSTKSTTDAEKRVLKALKYVSDQGLSLVEEKSYKNSLVHIAAQFLMRDVLDFLFDAKDYFSIDTHNADGNTPLHLAAREGHLTILKRLVSELKKRHPSRDLNILLSPRNTDNSTPAHHAAFNGKLEVLKFLHDEGASFGKETIDAFRSTLGHVACYKGHTHILEYLVEKKCLFDIGNCSENTPLHIAVSNGCLQATQFLVEKKLADPYARNMDGNTTIHLCAYNGSAEVLEYLGSQKLDLTKPNNYGDTPLHMAVLNNHAAVIKVLNHYNVPLESINDYGYTAQELAANEGNQEALKCLIGCIQLKNAPKTQPMHDISKTPLSTLDKHYYEKFLKAPTQKQIEDRYNPQLSAVPTPNTLVLDGQYNPGLVRMHVSWVLHKAVNFCPPSTESMKKAMSSNEAREYYINKYQKASQAALEGVSLALSAGRSYCKATRYIQAALYEKKMLSKANEKPSADPKTSKFTEENVVYHLRSARMYAKPLSPYSPSAQFLLMISNLHLATQMHALSKIDEFHALEQEAMGIYNRFKDASYPHIFADESLARAFSSIGNAFEKLGETEKAYDRTLIALQGFTLAANGRDSVNVAALLSNVGMLANQLGKMTEAFKYKKKSVEMFMRLYNKENYDRRVAMAMNNLACEYQVRGKYDLAIHYHIQALEIRKRLYKCAQHEKLAESFSNLGIALALSGRGDKAIIYLRRALDMNKVLHQGVAHHDTAISYFNLGATLLYVPGLLSQAKEYLETAKSLFETIKDTREEDIASCYNNLGICCGMQQDIVAAYTYKQKALDIRLKNKHQALNLASSLASVGTTLIKDRGNLSNFKKGQEYLRESISLIEKSRVINVDRCLAISSLLNSLIGSIEIDRDASSQRWLHVEFLALKNLPILKQVLHITHAFHQAKFTQVWMSAFIKRPNLYKEMSVQNKKARLFMDTEHKAMIQAIQTSNDESQIEEGHGSPESLFKSERRDGVEVTTSSIDSEMHSNNTLPTARKCVNQKSYPVNSDNFEYNDAYKEEIRAIIYGYCIDDKKISDALGEKCINFICELNRSGQVNITNPDEEVSQFFGLADKARPTQNSSDDSNEQCSNPKDLSKQSGTQALSAHKDPTLSPTRFISGRYEFELFHMRHERDTALLQCEESNEFVNIIMEANNVALCRK